MEFKVYCATIGHHRLVSNMMKNPESINIENLEDLLRYVDAQAGDVLIAKNPFFEEWELTIIG